MNNTLKSSLLKNGQYQEINKARREWAFNHNYEPLGECIANYGEEIVKVAKNMNIGFNKRTQRVRKKTESIILGGQCLFLTLTFNDKTLSKTSQKTRRKYVSLYLKSQAATYVANIDFGGRNGREHYHALVYAPSIDFKPWHKYGAIKGEKVRSNSEDVKKCSKYIVKLSRHALKDTAQGVRLIYSKNTAYLPPAFLFEED